ncbi:MAG: cyclic nucleotide-binding domain-containing protein [Anaerolineales bacterium]
MISPERLRKYQLFSKQTSEMLKEIAMLAEEVHFKKDHVVFFEGEIANRLYIIEEGSVMLTMNLGKGGEREISELSPLKKGEIAGWSAIIEPHIYKLGGVAAEDTLAISFDGNSLRELFDDHPVAGYPFLGKLAEVIGNRLISKCSEVMSMYA